jgi:hypothetical protein
MDRSIALITAIAALLFIGPACRSNDGEIAGETTAGKTTERTAPEEAMTQRWSEEMLTTLRQRCPMVVDGAVVEVSDTERGVALLFTTETGDIGDLRRRVQGMASRYQGQDGRGGFRWRHMGHGQGRGMKSKTRPMGTTDGHGPLPSLTAAVVDVDQGVQLTLTPKDASALEQLREHVRAHQIRMEAGECWMAAPPDANSNSSKWVENLFGG